MNKLDVESAGTQEAAPADAAAGFDISYWQRSGMNWGEAAQHNAFAYIRVSKGMNPDSAANAHLTAASQTDLLLGGYHYLVPDYNGRRQAIFFWSLLNGLPCKLPPALDVEENGLSVKQVKDFCDEWIQLTDLPLVIYTSASKWKQICGPGAQWASHFLLWVAHWNASKPTLPDVWSEHTFWQWGLQPGPEYGKPIDRDRYNGTVAELRARFAGEEPAIPATGEEPATPASGEEPSAPATGETPPTVAAPKWTLAVVYGTGAPTITGDCGRAGIPLTIVDPWLNEYPLTSGSNPQFGVGGFELYARPAAAGYRLRIEGQELTFDHKQEQTFLKLTWG